MSDKIIQPWLALLCRMIPDAEEGLAAFNVEVGADQVRKATWPKNKAPSGDLLAIAQLAISRQSTISSGADEAGKLLVAAPVMFNGKPSGVVAVQLNAPKAQQSAVLHLLQWGSVWLNLLRNSVQVPTGGTSPAVTDVLDAALHYEHVDEAATAAATVVSERLSCERVSIGLKHRLVMRVHGVSHSARFDKRANLLGNIEAAMDECVLADKPISYHPGSIAGTQPESAHSQLSRNTGDASLYTVPMRSTGGINGAMCCERGKGLEFHEEEKALLERIAGLLGPVLEMKRLRDRSPYLKIKEDLIMAPARWLMGAQSVGLKLALALIALVLVFVALPGEFRVSAPGVLEGTVQRAIVAPFDGYISDTHARAGESVLAGQVLARLEDRDIQLERRKWSSQQSEYLKQYDKALANLDHVQARISKAQSEQAAAQVALREDQLARTELVAPFDGYIISGDLSQLQGTPVERGQVLFEIAPLKEYRVMLDVDERDIAHLVTGQQGQLTLAALPDQRFTLEIQRISAIHQEQETRAFRVEARITDAQLREVLRPGMQGVAKVVVGRQPRILSWSRRLVGWVKLQAWKWLP